MQTKLVWVVKTIRSFGKTSPRNALACRILVKRLVIILDAGQHQDSGVTPRTIAYARSASGERASMSTFYPSPVVTGQRKDSKVRTVLEQVWPWLRRHVDNELGDPDRAENLADEVGGMGYPTTA